MDAAGLARQKLQSLLENNLLKRRRELTEGAGNNDDDEGGSSSGDSGGSRRISRGRMSTAAIQAQRKEDLEERQRERDAAQRTLEDLEARLESARQVNEQLRCRSVRWQE